MFRLILLVHKLIPRIFALMFFFLPVTVSASNGAISMHQQSDGLNDLAQKLSDTSLAIGNLTPNPDTRPLSNRIRLGENGLINVIRTYVTAAPTGDGRARKVYDTRSTKVNPRDVLSLSVSFGGAAHLVGRGDSGYCNLIGLNMEVADGGENGKSETKPVSFYACADKAAEMRKVYQLLLGVLTEYGVTPYQPNSLSEADTWRVPSPKSWPYLAIVESKSVANGQQFVDVPRLKKLKVGKDHNFKRVILIDPVGVLVGKRWKVRTGTTYEEDSEFLKPLIFDVNAGANPEIVAKQLRHVLESERKRVISSTTDLDVVAEQVRMDRERLVYLVGLFPYSGNMAMYQLQIEGKWWTLGSIVAE